jgi:hypothetical protein
MKKSKKILQIKKVIIFNFNIINFFLEKIQNKKKKKKANLINIFKFKLKILFSMS